MQACASNLAWAVKLLLILFFWVPCSLVCAELPMVVLITSYNNKRLTTKNLGSVFSQDYSNYRVIYIDDASQDGTADSVEKLTKRHNQKSRMRLIRNTERKGALANIYTAIHQCCEDKEIIVSLDGDDWFYDNQVLKKINAVYLEKQVWLTHGTMMEFPYHTCDWSVPIPEEIIDSNAFRKYRCPSHLRTFYAWLFKEIKIEDLQYNGEFFKMTWDQAIMFPMIEMAGRRHAFISDVTYVYNVVNPINDNKVDPQLQNNLEAYIRSMEPYLPIPSQRHP